MNPEWRLQSDVSHIAIFAPQPAALKSEQNDMCHLAEWYYQLTVGQEKLPKVQAVLIQWRMRNTLQWDSLSGFVIQASGDDWPRLWTGI